MGEAMPKKQIYEGRVTGNFVGFTDTEFSRIEYGDFEVDLPGERSTVIVDGHWPLLARVEITIEEKP
jgi:hypothetical protein